MSAFHVGLFICIMAASSVVSSDVKQERVLEGKDVCLHIQKPDRMQDPEDLRWKFHDMNIVKYTFRDKKKRIHPNYQGGRVVFFDNYSLLLKNLQKSDSGLYQAIAEIGSEDVLVAQYNVTVEDAVTPAEPAALSLARPPVSSSPGSCYLTVWSLLMGNFIVFLVFPF